MSMSDEISLLLICETIKKSKLELIKQRITQLTQSVKCDSLDELIRWGKFEARLGDNESFFGGFTSGCAVIISVPATNAVKCGGTLSSKQFWLILISGHYVLLHFPVDIGPG